MDIPDKLDIGDLMQNYSESVMIALIPGESSWSKLITPHLTLVFAGETKDLKLMDMNELAKDAASIAAMNQPITLRVLGVDVMGTDEQVDVLSFLPTPELLAMRRVVERWNKSVHPFRPHATIGEVGTRTTVEIPTHVNFDKVVMAWGNEHMYFSMR